jgi:RNA polymerase sigma-70 factor (ECF subfamily)
MAQLDEQALLAGLKQGHKKSVRVWYQKYYQRMLNFVSQKIDAPKDAEDITQEVFINSLSQLPLFRGKSKLFTWMCSLARHEIADFYRKKYAKKALKMIPLGSRLLSVEIEDASATSEKVIKVLEQMSDEYKELLMAKYVDAKKVKDLAEELGKSVKSVESDLYRARCEFRVLYAKLDL